MSLPRRDLTDVELRALGLQLPPRKDWGPGERLEFLNGWGYQRAGHSSAMCRNAYQRAGWLEAEHWQKQASP